MVWGWESEMWQQNQENSRLWGHSGGMWKRGDLSDTLGWTVKDIVNHVEEFLFIQRNGNSK